MLALLATRHPDRGTETRAAVHGALERPRGSFTLAGVRLSGDTTPRLLSDQQGEAGSEVERWKRGVWRVFRGRPPRTILYRATVRFEIFCGASRHTTREDAES